MARVVTVQVSFCHKLVIGCSVPTDAECMCVCMGLGCLGLTVCRQGYLPTAELRGPRLIPLRPASHTETINMLGLNDPWQASGISELEDEWKLIPEVCGLEAVHEDACNFRQPAFASHQHPVLFFFPLATSFFTPASFRCFCLVQVMDKGSTLRSKTDFNRRTQPQLSFEVTNPVYSSSSTTLVRPFPVTSAWGSALYNEEDEEKEIERDGRETWNHNAMQFTRVPPRPSQKTTQEAPARTEPFRLVSAAVRRMSSKTGHLTTSTNAIAPAPSQVCGSCKPEPVPRKGKGNGKGNGKGVKENKRRLNLTLWALALLLGKRLSTDDGLDKSCGWV